MSFMEKKERFTILILENKSLQRPKNQGLCLHKKNKKKKKEKARKVEKALLTPHAA